MPAEPYGVELSLKALVKAWVDHHPGGEHERDHAARWLQSTLRLLDRYTSTFETSDWAEVEDEVERYRDNLSEGAFRNIVRLLPFSSLSCALSTHLTCTSPYTARQDRRSEHAACPTHPEHARRRRRRRGASRCRAQARTGAASSLPLPS